MTRSGVVSLPRSKKHEHPGLDVRLGGGASLEPPAMVNYASARAA